MKDAVITVRLPRATRQRIAALARKQGRSLSQQVERLIDQAMGMERAGPPRKTIKDIFAGRGPVPTLEDFREVRRLWSESLERRARHFDKRGR